MPTRPTACAVVFGLTLAFGGAAAAHPGSGIVVDHQGQVYFADTGGGVLRIDRDGSLKLHSGSMFHWLAIDYTSRFATARALSTASGQITAVGTQPTLVLSSDFPVTIGGDGALYYPELAGDVLRIMRVDAAAHRSVRATLPHGNGRRALRWLNGLAAGPDGSLYYTDDTSVSKVDASGQVSTVAQGFTIPDCSPIPASDEASTPYLRGLDVAPDGTVYVAASGCGAVLKITARGVVTPILRAVSPWSPTAIALAGGDIYVLEYLHTANENRKEWLPRVRKRSPDGTIHELAAVIRK